MQNTIEKKCLECGELLVFKAKIHFTRKNFCSRKCNCSYYAKLRMKDKDYKDKLLQASRSPDAVKKHRENTKRGIHNPNWKGGKIQKKCLVCDKLFSVFRYKDGKGNGLYCSKKCYLESHVKPRVEINCLQCGKLFLKIEKRAKKAKFCSHSCCAIYTRVHGYKRINQIESKMECILKDLNLYYQFEKDVGNKVVVDFLLENNVCIFCDGEYWHSSEESVNRDVFVNEYLDKLGYKVLRFKDVGIDDDYENVKMTIKEVSNFVL